MAAEPRRADEAYAETLGEFDAHLRAAALRHCGCKSITYRGIPGFDFVVLDVWDGPTAGQNVDMPLISLCFHAYGGRRLGLNVVRHRVFGTRRSSAFVNASVGVSSQLNFGLAQGCVFGLGYVEDTDQITDFVKRVARLLYTMLKHKAAELVLKHEADQQYLKARYAFFIQGTWWVYERAQGPQIHDVEVTEIAFADAASAGLQVFDGC